MARYIDADKLIAHLKDEIEGCKPPFGGRANGKSIAYGTELGLKSAISFAETLSTADVVPKSEVERLQCQVNRLKKYDEERDIALHARLIANAKAEVAREIFEEFRTQMREKVGINEGMAKTFPYDADFYKGRADAYIDAINAIAELKKKYTEESNEVQHS